jgi:demethylmenaquinone methyltransferase/2-methoxy-6-polyprenyl-1,4-benzoquinol methylase
LAIQDLPLRQAIATPQTKRDCTRRVFATIADRYDFVNVLLSFNRDRAWKRRMVARANFQPHEVALDAASGTGDIAFGLAGGGGRVVGLDITPRMIELARTRAARTRDRVDFLIGDMMTLPFGDATFDLVTTGYGIRNVPDINAAVHEIRRVLRPGGRFFSLDFNRPANAWVRAAYLAWLTMVGSAIGWVLHGEADTYRYIPETIRVHPGAAAVVSLLAAAGFKEASYEPVFGGFMAMHRAVRDW